jgi:integrase
MRNRRGQFFAVDYHSPLIYHSPQVLNTMPTSHNKYSPGLFPKLLHCLSSDDAIALSKYGTSDASRLYQRRDGLVVRILLATGLRRAELASISLESFSWWRNQLWISITGKGGRQRVIPFPPSLFDELKALRVAYNAPPSVAIPSLHRSKVVRVSCSTIYRGVARASKSILGARTHPHALRHTSATQMIASGASLIGVQGILGHSSIATTERYLHKMPSSMIAAASSRFYQSIGIEPDQAEPDALKLAL